jgi:hypothetical protein
VRILLGLVFGIFTLIGSAAAQQEDSLFVIHIVRRGETLAGLFGENWEIVAKINSIDPRALRVGMRLRVPRDWKKAATYTPLPEFLPKASLLKRFVLVDLARQYLAGYENGVQKFWYPISSGLNPAQTPHWYIREVVRADSLYSKRRYKDSLPDLSTPTGLFFVLAKDSAHVSNAFLTEDGLGAPMPWAVAFRWGYWFHGVYNNPKGLPGFPASHGCIRLFDKDARSFYYWVDRETVILIVENVTEMDAYFDKLDLFLKNGLKSNQNPKKRGEP